MKYFSYIYFLFLFPFIKINAQPNLGSIEALDSVYESLVHSAHFNDGVNTVAFPIFLINQKETLNFEFDLLEGSPRRLYYSFKYCDRNWKESPIDILEIIEGLNENEINQFQTSFTTYVSYVHYRLNLLPPQLKFRQSGNYLLIIYDQESHIYLTKKIYVVNPIFTATANFVQPVDSRYIRTYQSLNILINTGNLNVFNPSQEIQLEIIQNGNHLTKKILHEPLFFAGNILRYTRTDEILFPGGKEFRGVDVRSIQRKGLAVQYWDEKKGEFHCYIKPDIFRKYKNYIFTFDYNGKMVYTSSDVPIDVARTRSEYFYLHFKLECKEKLENDVYVYGLISDWKLKEEFKMKYDPVEHAYTASIYTKNAWVDYGYATLDENRNISMAEIDGDWYETENDYHILCYYRPFGGRFDQLCLAANINSNRN